MNHLIDEENVEEFRGGTLQLNTSNNPNNDPIYTIERSTPATLDPSAAQSRQVVNPDEPAVSSGYDFVSPITSGSSTGERNENRTNHMLPQYHIPFAFENAKDYFSYRNGLVESALDECSATLIFPNQDGLVIGSWLLTEISLWDNEKERLVILTDRVLITVKYDFIALKQLDFRKVYLEEIDTVAIGDLKYPPSSLVPNRNMRGVRAMWNRGQPLPFMKKWNPFDKTVPMNTFSSHPLFWHKDTPDGPSKDLYDVDHFGQKLVAAVETINEGRDPPCKILHAPIVLPNYVGLTSLVHNKNSLGFFKVRGKFSF